MATYVEERRMYEKAEQEAIDGEAEYMVILEAEIAFRTKELAFLNKTYMDRCDRLTSKREALEKYIADTCTIESAEDES
jgi:hypothetical protein